MVTCADVSAGRQWETLGTYVVWPAETSRMLRESTAQLGE
jgi:hypothetical protein